MMLKIKFIISLLLLNIFAIATEYGLTYSHTDDIQPKWSPDGTKIAYASRALQVGANYDIYIINSNGGNPSNITNTPNYSEASPSWSPDGSKIAFYSDMSGRWQIWIMSPTGGNITRVTNNLYDDSCPCWSPDGSRIAFFSDRNGNLDIYSINIDGTNEQRLTTYAGEDRIPDYSPDGTKIAFDSQRPYSPIPDIWIMDSNGGNEQWVSYDIHNDFGASWSPDGTKIAFSGQGLDYFHIYWVPVNGGNATQVTYGMADFEPDWSPDGNKICYRHDTGNGYNIWVKDLNTEQPFSYQRASCGWIKANFKY